MPHTKQTTTEPMAPEQREQLLAKVRTLATPQLATADLRVIRLAVNENPKKGLSAKRFALYRNGMTVQQYLEMGGFSSDIAWDLAHGYITVTRIEELSARINDLEEALRLIGDHCSKCQTPCHNTSR